jgi:hypothetical protein
MPHRWRHASAATGSVRAAELVYPLKQKIDIRAQAAHGRVLVTRLAGSTGADYMT